MSTCDQSPPVLAHPTRAQQNAIKNMSARPAPDSPGSGGYAREEINFERRPSPRRDDATDLVRASGEESVSDLLSENDQLVRLPPASLVRIRTGQRMTLEKQRSRVITFPRR